MDRPTQSRDKGKGKQRSMTREAAFKKSKAKAEAERKRQHQKATSASGSASGNASSSTMPQMTSSLAQTRAIVDDPHPFRYKSFHDRLSSVHIAPGGGLTSGRGSTLAGLDVQGKMPEQATASHVDDEDEDDDNEEARIAALQASTAFGTALATWRELNLSVPFQDVLQKVQRHSHSLPMLLHHRVTIVDALCGALNDASPLAYLAYEPVLDLLPRLALDLGSEFLPVYPMTLAASLRAALSTKNTSGGDEQMAAKLVERAFESVAALFRNMAPLLLQRDSGAGGRDWLEETWVIIRPYLGWQTDDSSTAMNSTGAIHAASAKPVGPIRVPPHVRRFASEAFAHLLRRSNQSHWRNAATFMLYDVQLMIARSRERAVRFAAGVAGIWSEVAKSVDRRLHSQVATQLSALLVETDESVAGARLIVGRLLITALVHHGHATHLVPLFELLIGIAGQRLDTESRSEGQLAESMYWLESAVATRKGTRVDDAVKPKIFAFLAQMSSTVVISAADDSELSAAAALLIAAAMPIGRIPDLVGPGIKVIDTLAKARGADGASTALFSTVVLSLASEALAWSGFTQFVLPQVLSCTAGSLPREGAPRIAALRLLSQLSSMGHLRGTSGSEQAAQSPQMSKWLRVSAPVIAEELRVLAATIEKDDWANVVAHLPALTLVSSVATTDVATTLCESLHRIIELLVSRHLHSADSAKSICDVGPANPASVLGASATALTGLADALPSNSTIKATIAGLCTPTLCTKLLQALPQHRYALQSSLQLFRKSDKSRDLPAVSEVGSSLWQALMSEDEQLRGAATGWLELLGSSNNEGQATFAAMNAVESLPLRVDTVRDRNVRLRSIARELLRLATDDKDASEADKIAPFVLRFIVSTLKINFKPIWEESRKALADLSSRYSDSIWELTFAGLIMKETAGDVPASWQVGSSTDVQGRSDLLDLCDSMEADEGSDKSFVDPQRSAKEREVSSKWTLAHTESTQTIQRSYVELQRNEGRLDLANYQAQLLTLLSELPHIVEKPNHEFMKHFFAVVVDEPMPDEHGEDDEEEDETSNTDISNKLTVRQRDERLSAYLKVFAKFSNPKALHRSKDLHDFLYAQAARGEVKIQRQALECILTWKDSSQLAYADKMAALLDHSKFRDELASFDLSVTGDSIQPHHREALMPLLVRLLFGLAISRQGKTSSSTSGAGKKVAILNALSGCAAEELKVWVDLMLSALEDQRPRLDEMGRLVVSDAEPRAFPQQQLGFLSLLGETIKHLGAQLLPHWQSLVAVTINLAHHSANKASEQGPGPASAQSRDIRQAAVRRLADFFRCPVSDQFRWKAFTPAIFAHIVSPRLPVFAAENAQSPSALLDLIAVWSTRKAFVHLLVEGDQQVLPSLYSTLSVSSVKNPVVTVILDTVERLLVISEHEEEVTDTDADGDTAVSAAPVVSATDVQDRILRPFISPFVEHIAPLVKQTAASLTNSPNALLQREIQLLSRMASFVHRAEDATQILGVLAPLMRKNNRLVPERSKADLLSTFKDLLLLTDDFRDPQSDLFIRHYELFSSLWSKLRSRPARLKLAAVFGQMAQVDGANLSRAADWVEELNAYSVRRLDEADFDRRITAFESISAAASSVGQDNPAVDSLSEREWLPVVHNMLFFIQDAEELVMRSNASAVLRSFVAAVHATSDPSLAPMFSRTVYPALARTLRSRSELVRREVLTVMDAAVKELCDEVPTLHEMQGLLAGGDHEANFFYNIHHIQLHRRARALRRLGDQAASGALKSKTLSDVFLPLIGHFLETGNTEIGDHNLVNETLNCLGKLTNQLQWSAYNATLWKYLRLADAKTAGERVYVRASLSILDNFHFAMDDRVDEAKDGADGAEEDADDALEDGGSDGEAEANAVQLRAKATAERQRIVTSVTGKLLPSLMGYLEHHDRDTDDALRLPIAVGVVRVVECLPEGEKEIHLAKLLNILANVSRSKSQETRDLARDTLCKAAVVLGPARLPQLVREQRRALTRGPQLAVLATNVHSVLVRLIQDAQSSLDLLDSGVVSDIVDIASEDLFGHTGEDRETVEYKTKVRELRQSKSLDTFEQLAKIVAPRRISAMLLPLKAILEQTEVPRAVKAVEDALRRMASGINANTHFRYDDFLNLCHSLISANASFLKPRKAAPRSAKQQSQDLVLLKRKDVESGAGNKRDHFAANAFRFVGFGLELLITALRRSRFDFGDDDVLSRLDPLLADVGNTLYAGDSGVLTLGLRAAGALLRCPLPSLASSLPVVVRQTVSIITREGNPSSEVSQAALRTLTIMLRDCPEQANFKEKQLTDLLTLVISDIEEPNAQSAIFGLVRAIISRRYVVPEVYDVMDKVAEMMVTNQSSSVRETSRAAFLQFLLDYPQGKGRLRNQMEFLAKNLSYIYESGRLSVMELLTAICAKFSDEVLRDYGELLFVALVMVLANDDSTRCREKAAQLAKTIVTLLEDDQQSKLIGMAHAWAENSEQKAQLSRVGMQVYSLFLDAGVDASVSQQWTSRALKVTRQVLSDCADDLESIEREDASLLDTVELDWQLPYHSLQLLSRIAAAEPSLLAPSQGSPVWSVVRRLLLFPHSWVRSAACRLIGTLFAAAPHPAGSTSPARDSSTSNPLSLEALVDVARKLALQLRGTAVDDAMALQVVKNLLWIGKSFAAVPAPTSMKRKDAVANGNEQLEGDESSVSEADEASDDEMDGEEEDNDDEAQTGVDASALENPLAWLFSKLSYQARDVQRPGGDGSNMESRLNIQGPKAILRWFAAMAQFLPKERLATFLPHIVTPIFRLLDEDTIKIGQHASLDELKTLASEVQDLLTDIVGSTAYSAAFSAVRSKALEKRRQRKTDRLMKGVVASADPEAEAKRREKRNQAKHQSRKRKNEGFAAGKGKPGKAIKRVRRQG